MNKSSIDIAKLQDDIKKIKQFIADIRKLGGKMPALERAVNRLEFAVNTGADLGAAARETSKALKAYTDDLYKACGDDYVCRARVARQYQARSVNWTLSWNRRESVVRSFVRRTLRRYLPDSICKRLDACK